MITQSIHSPCFLILNDAFEEIIKALALTQLSEKKNTTMSQMCIVLLI
jgi:hypothetical protein